MSRLSSAGMSHDAAPQPPGGGGEESAQRWLHRVLGVVYSALFHLGLVTIGLLIVWYGLQTREPPIQHEIVVDTIGGGRGDNPPGIGLDSLPLATEDAAAGEGAVSDAPIEQTLSWVAATTEMVESQDVSIHNLEMQTQTGLGDRRRPGPQGPGTEDGVPRHERWTVTFVDGITRQQYAQQLDFFGIELAVVTPGQEEVTYLFKLASGKPSARQGMAKEDNRLRMNWRSGELRDADRDLVSRGGLDPNGKLIVQVYPADAENQLALAEQEYAKNRRVSQIRRTIFEIQPVAGAFRFKVKYQYYL